MNRAPAVLITVRRQADKSGAVARWGQGWAWGSMVAALLTLSLALLGEGAPGDLDPMSGGGGTVTTDFGGREAANALVLQPDGKLVAAGHSGSGGFADFDFALARYLPDGRLDPTFGTGGKVTTDFGPSSAARALILQPDGKLVAAGNIIFPIPINDFGTNIALARYLPDGSLDPTFGIGGKVTTDFAGPWASALLLQPDGKLVAAGPGYSGVCCFEHFALARYLPDGSLDATFGIGGKVTTDFGGNGLATLVNALVLQPAGKLVAAGAGSEDCCTQRFALARFLPDGTLDVTFGIGGIVTTDFPVTAGFDSDQARALVMQPDGKLVAAGAVGDFGVDFGLARYLPDGRLDPTFGTGSKVKVNALVTFEPIPSTFTFTPDPAGCPEGFAGTFSFEARLTNISESSLTDLVVAVANLTNGNLLQNADSGPGGIGAQLTVPQQDGFSDDVLSADEFVEVPFIICLTEREPFTFVVDVLGNMDASTDAQAKAPLAK